MLQIETENLALLGRGRLSEKKFKMVFSHKLFKSTLPFAARRLSSSQGGSKGTGPGIGLLVGVGSFSGMAYLLTHRESSTYHALCDNDHGHNNKDHGKDD